MNPCLNLAIFIILSKRHCVPHALTHKYIGKSFLVWKNIYIENNLLLISCCDQGRSYPYEKKSILLLTKDCDLSRSK